MEWGEVGVGCEGKGGCMGSGGRKMGVVVLVLWRGWEGKEGSLKGYGGC